MYRHGRPRAYYADFFSHETLCERFLLDGIITLVDAVHAEKQLNDFAIAQAQIGYADRILLTKTDINSDNTVLIERLQRINARAPVYSVTHGAIDVGLLFDVQGFILNDQLNISQPKLRFVPKQQNEVQSIVVELDYPVELMAVSQVMEELLLSFADNLLRYKGILSIVDQPCRLLFQGVQRLYSADWDREWQENEPRNSVMVFIGVSLPESLIRQKFASLKLAEH